jgi:hypothetical protein
MLHGLKLVAFSLVCLSLSACETTGPKQAVTEECRLARAEYQMCYGSCLGSTPGGILQAAGICGNRCRQESYALNRACR